MPRAPDTCRAPRSKSFFFGGGAAAAPAAALPVAAKSDDGLLLEEEEEGGGGGSSVGGGVSPAISPAGGPNMGGLAMTMELWRQEAQEGGRPQSQAFGTRGPSLESYSRGPSVSSRLSGSLSPPRRR